jgi:hypothetical protein
MPAAEDFYLDQRKANRRIAEMLIGQGVSTEPISAHSQGINRIAQALIGGLGIARGEQQDKEREASRMAALLADPRLGGGIADVSAAPVATPAGPIYSSDFGGRAPDGMDRSISSGPRSASLGPIATAPPSTATGSMGGGLKGWAPDERIDLPPKETPLDVMMPRTQVASALQAAMGGAPPLTGATPPGAIPVPTQSIQPPPQAAFVQPPMAAPAQVVAQASRTSPPIDPTMVPYIKRLMSRPETQQYGAQLLQSLTKSTKYEKLDEGTLFDPSTGQTKNVGERYRALVDPAERAQHGIPADDKRPYQLGPSGKLINPPAETRIAIDQRTESKFREKAGGLTAERFNDYVKSGDEARGMVADLDSLREIGSRVTTGKTAEIKAALGPYAEALGVKIDQLGDLQAYNAITAKMAPRMRVPGSGATSDFEMRQYLEALPTLGKTPEGNEIIANTNQSLLLHRQKVAEIASRAMAEEITPRDAEKMIRELPDPMAMWKKSRGSSPAAAPGSGNRTKSGIQWSVE